MNESAGMDRLDASTSAHRNVQDSASLSPTLLPCLCWTIEVRHNRWENRAVYSGESEHYIMGNCGIMCVPTSQLEVLLIS